ncbi:ERB1 protein, partial [Certhia brachydactyla]|nr:ERB1 protein [Certhia brachydactyla]
SSYQQGYGYRRPGNYCGTNTTANQGLGAYGAETRGGRTIWNNATVKALPPGVFLICGDRAWQGVPARVIGGPCYLGKLTLMSPGQEFIGKLTQRYKRSLSKLSPDCDDNVQLWRLAARFGASLIPSLGTAHALASINKLAYWAVRQSNVTTQVLTQLAGDVDSSRRAVLQNRAAIDFLLLAQGHGCNAFEGMCCFNMSDHSKSIKKQLQWLADHAKKIQVVTSPFDTWLTSIFGSISPWLSNLIKEGI